MNFENSSYVQGCIGKYSMLKSVSNYFYSVMPTSLNSGESISIGLSVSRLMTANAIAKSSVVISILSSSSTSSRFVVSDGFLC